MTTSKSVPSSDAFNKVRLSSNFWIDLTEYGTSLFQLYYFQIPKTKNFSSDDPLSAQKVLIEFIKEGGDLSKLVPNRLKAGKKDQTILKCDKYKNTKYPIYLRSVRYLKYVIRSIRSRLLTQFKAPYKLTAISMLNFEYKGEWKKQILPPKTKDDILAIIERNRNQVYKVVGKRAMVQQLITRKVVQPLTKDSNTTWIDFFVEQNEYSFKLDLIISLWFRNEFKNDKYNRIIPKDIVKLIGNKYCKNNRIEFLESLELNKHESVENKNILNNFKISNLLECKFKWKNDTLTLRTNGTYEVCMDNEWRTGLWYVDYDNSDGLTDLNIEDSNNNTTQSLFDENNYAQVKYIVENKLSHDYLGLNNRSLTAKFSTKSNRTTWHAFKTCDNVSLMMY